MHKIDVWVVLRSKDLVFGAKTGVGTGAATSGLCGKTGHISDRCFSQQKNAQTKVGAEIKPETDIATRFGRVIKPVLRYNPPTPLNTDSNPIVTGNME